jgi:Nucleotidyl transferase AbiEii toxin, Type IV TA system
MVKLGIANTRMKDFYDLEVLSRTLPFHGRTLSEAIRKTSQNRGTTLPAGGSPLAFTPEFYEDASKKRQWTAFCTKNATYVAKTEFKSVIDTLQTFLVPVVKAVGENTLFSKHWKPGGPWR